MDGNMETRKDGQTETQDLFYYLNRWRGLFIFVIVKPKESLDCTNTGKPSFGGATTMNYNLWEQNSAILQSVSYERKA